jgi:monoterpene epsilon-lactone hydrolase
MARSAPTAVVQKCDRRDPLCATTLIEKVPRLVMKAVDVTDLLVPQRRVPAPSTISEEARATIINGSPLAHVLFGEPEPEPHDKEGWRRFVAKRDALGTPLVESARDAYPCERIERALPHTILYELIPSTLASGAERCAVLFLHGGGYTSAGGIAGAYLAMPVATKLALTTYALDYRMPPDHPFPAGLEDGVDAYRLLLERYRPADMVIAGRSAGGGLAAALALRLRDLGLPLPGACVLWTPEADLTESGDSFALNNGVDNFLRPLPRANALYADGEDLRNPYISPLFGDFGPGFPPTILTTGTRDLFLSNTVLLHRALRRAQVAAELHVWEAMGHGGFFEQAPEDAEVWNEVRTFIYSRLRIEQ